MATLEVAEGRKVQSTDGSVAYTVDTSNVGTNPTNATVTAFDLTNGYLNVSTAVLAGTASASGAVITTPAVHSLTAGHLYRMEVKFTISTNVYEHYFEIQCEKGARNGTSHLLVRLREMVNDEDGSKFGDGELQDVLDEFKVRIHREMLEAEKTYTSNTTYEYTVFHSRYANWEGVASGTAYFQVQDSAGSQRGSTLWSMDYVRGVLTMSADQGGTELYMTGWVHDLNRAASELWRRLAGSVSGYYSFGVDGHTLSRSDWFKHCIDMSKYYAAQARPITVRSWRVGDWSMD